MRPIAVTLALLSAAFIVHLSPARAQINNSTPRTKVQAVQAGLPRKEATEKAQTEQQAGAQALVEPEIVREAATVATPAPQPVTPKEIAQTKAAKRGWTGAEWQALDELWHNESGWNPGAVNKWSGACGLPQALPCSKIPDPDSVDSQIDWGLGYIANRYDTPSKALAFWKFEAPIINGSNWY